MEDVVMALKKKYPNDHERAFAIAWSQYNKKHGIKESGFTDTPGYDGSPTQDAPSMGVCTPQVPINVPDKEKMNKKKKFSAPTEATAVPVRLITGKMAKLPPAKSSSSKM
jgi:hypothetical protein